MRFLSHLATFCACFSPLGVSLRAVSGALSSASACRHRIKSIQPLPIPSSSRNGSYQKAFRSTKFSQAASRSFNRVWPTPPLQPRTRLLACSRIGSPVDTSRPCKSDTVVAASFNAPSTSRRMATSAAVPPGAVLRRLNSSWRGPSTHCCRRMRFSCVGSACNAASSACAPRRRLGR